MPECTPLDLHHHDLGNGPAVVLVHGFPIEGSMWNATADILTGHFRVVVPDQRGFGRSPPSASPTMATYADDLARLLDHLDIDRPALLAGLSFGGYVLMEFLRRHPSRVDAIGLIDTREVADTPQAAAERRESADRLDAGGPVSAVVDRMLPILLGPDTSTRFINHWQGVLSRQHPMGVAAALRAMADRPDSTETLRAFAGRALVIAGEHDALTPVDIHKRMAGLLGRSELQVIPGCGHLAPTECPKPFAAVVQRFLLG